MTPGAIELIALCVVIVAAFIGLIWAYENWSRRVVISPPVSEDEAHGETINPAAAKRLRMDAADVSRRVNHERRKA
jgi:uncharacterized membrane protein